MRRPFLSRPLEVVLAVLVTAVSAVLTLLIGYGGDTALGVAGLVFGLATLVLSQVRDREGPKKKIWYVGQEDVVFNDNVLKGLAGEVGGIARDGGPVAPSPPRGKDVLAWQVALLGGQEAESYDAVVILPAEDDRQIWDELARLRRAGTMLVVIDIEPKYETFLGQELEPPVFVSSDFNAGGRLAGAIVSEALRADSNATAVVAIGPAASPPGAGRSAQLLFCLAQAGLLGRVDSVELKKWDTAEACAGLTAAVEARLSTDPLASAVVFCGDDRIMAAVARVARGRPQWPDRVRLVGYDGTMDAGGEYLAEVEKDLCIGTIDTQPSEQGKAAGEALVQAYRGRTRAERRRRIVTPRAVLPPNWH